MPIKIIRQDITKIKCDAIVNPTNRHMFPGGGADAAIHEAAGPELFEYCQTLGGVSVGEAKITPAFNNIDNKKNLQKKSASSFESIDSYVNIEYNNYSC